MHFNRFKPAHGGNVIDSKPRPRHKRTRKQPVSSQESEQAAANKIGACPLAQEIPRQNSTLANREVSSDQLHGRDSPFPTRRDIDTPTAERTHPTYRPADSPTNRRELQDTRIETRSLELGRGPFVMSILGQNKLEPCSWHYAKQIAYYEIL